MESPVEDLMESPVVEGRGFNGVPVVEGRGFNGVSRGGGERI